MAGMRYIPVYKLHSMAGPGEYYDHTGIALWLGLGNFQELQNRMILGILPNIPILILLLFS